MGANHKMQNWLGSWSSTSLIRNVWNWRLPSISCDLLRFHTQHTFFTICCHHPSHVLWFTKFDAETLSNLYFEPRLAFKSFTANTKNSVFIRSFLGASCVNLQKCSCGFVARILQRPFTYSTISCKSFLILLSQMWKFFALELNCGKWKPISVYVFKRSIFVGARRPGLM